MALDDARPALSLAIFTLQICEIFMEVLGLHHSNPIYADGSERVGGGARAALCGARGS